MKLYNKKLRSLAELKHEKQLLMREEQVTRKHMKDPWAGLTQTKLNKDDTDTDGIDWVSVIAKFFGGAKSLPVNIALSLAGPLLGKMGRKGGGIIKKLAIEVLGGYLKWKLLDIGFNLAKKMLKGNKKSQNNNK